MTERDAAARAAERWERDGGMLGDRARNGLAALIREEYAKDALRWTTETPKVPGWYWVRGYREDYLNAESQIVQAPRVVRLLEDMCGLCVDQFDFQNVDEMPGAEWAGPLEPPA